jgi:type II secretory pathway pseudopilin PulG
MFRAHKTTRQRGFTLIELMLAIGFVGSLLVLIALIIIQIMGLYNKGLTLKEVNEVSRVVVRDMQQSVSGSDAFRLQYLKDDTPTYATTFQQAVNPGGNNSQIDYYSNDAGGRLCTGVYSYVWNTGGAIRLVRDNADAKTYRTPGNNNAPATGYPIQFVNRTNADGSTKQVPARFIKKRDTAKDLCRLPAGDELATTTHDRSLGNENEFINVFGTGNNELVLYNFSIETPLKPTSENRMDDLTAVSTFYYVKLIVGTQNGDENTQNGLITSTEVCKPPAEALQNEGEYCAVNKIDFVARTGRIGN